MKPWAAIQLAIDMAQRQRDQLAQALARAIQAQQSAHMQMQMLQSYARETENKGFARAQVMTSAELIRHQDQFLSKLAQAVSFQQGVIQGHDGQVAQARQALIEADQKLSRFQHLLAARQAAWAQESNRREQKQADELATQRAARQKRLLGAEDLSWVSN